MPSASSRLSGLRARDSILQGWTIAVLVFLYLPILVLAAYSFNASRLNIVWGGFTFGWYRQVWENGGYGSRSDRTLEAR